MDTSPTPSTAPSAKERLTGYLAEFSAFLKKTNALAVAIGICLGLAVKDVVDGVVVCFIQPIIGLVSFGGGGWGLRLWIFEVGRFIGICINFVIIAWVLFMISKWFLKEEKKAA